MHKIIYILLFTGFYLQFSIYNVSIFTFLFAISNFYLQYLHPGYHFLSPSLKAPKLCFTLISLGRPFHILATLYLTDFIRKFEVHVGPGEGKTIIIFSFEIIFAVIKNIYFSFAARGSGGKRTTTCSLHGQYVKF